MNPVMKWVISLFTDEDLKEELRKRGYVTDIKIQFSSSIDGEPREFSAIGKDVISNG